MSKDQAEAQAKADYEYRVRDEGFGRWLSRVMRNANSRLPTPLTLTEDDHEQEA